MVPDAVVDMVPVRVVEMIPVRVVEMIPVRVVEMVPGFASAEADIPIIKIPAQNMD